MGDVVSIARTAPINTANPSLTLCEVYVDANGKTYKSYRKPKHFPQPVYICWEVSFMIQMNY